MIQVYQNLQSIPNTFLLGIYSELFYKLRNLIIVNCCNIRVIDTKFGAPGNRTPLLISFISQSHLLKNFSFKFSKSDYFTINFEL